VKRALWAIAAFVVLMAAVWGGFAWRRHATFGTIAGGDRTTVTVDGGDRLSLSRTARRASSAVATASSSRSQAAATFRNGAAVT
jgi:hypothetical protein